ncbi:exosporium protein C [Effusibacillus dendaii]|uniref:Exosporium protein C n=1 Tax=Effusibacillus dendaii TaxID=2743772 RepID=A0A7I8DEA6_9BACL|nr:exosporium protein C [Effusibacillus dendaii]BCJ88538.1 hypothetical protein skT53_35230 [Effusibacillus dendaii]
MVRIVDFRATEPRRRFNLGRATVIPQSQRRLRLATLRVTLPQRATVKLLGTVGVRGVTGIAQVLFRIFRDGREIFNTQQGIESAGSEQNYTVTFQAIDFNVTGNHTYTLTAENRTVGTTATIVGPVSFSALSVRRKNR